MKILKKKNKNIHYNIRQNDEFLVKKKEFNF